MELRAQSDKYPRRTDRLQDEQFHSGFDTLVSYQAFGFITTRHFSPQTGK